MASSAGAGLGSGRTGKLGHAWVGAWYGAWRGAWHGMVDGCMVVFLAGR